jgi:hypothetical protein
MAVINKHDIQRVVYRSDGGEVKRCVRCILPENYPGVHFDAEGVCNFCRVFDRQWGSWMASKDEQAQSEARLKNIFEAVKQKRRPYDALIGISGGKDSSYMLYLCREVYGLNLLTFTNDSGQMADEAKERVEKLVKIFNVPHVWCHEPLWKEISGIFMRKAGAFCSICQLSCHNFSEILTREYNIPIWVIGSSSRTEYGMPKHLNPWDPWFFNNVLKGEPYKERLHHSCFGTNFIIREGLAKLVGRHHLVILPDYVEWDEDKINELFKKKYGFDFGDEHSDCWASKVAAHIFRTRLGGIDHRIGKYSLFIRTGKLTRQQALEKVNQPEVIPIPGIDRFLEFTGLTLPEFEAACQQSVTPYMGTITTIFNEFRKKMRRQAG